MQKNYWDEKIKFWIINIIVEVNKDKEWKNILELIYRIYR